MSNNLSLEDCLDDLRKEYNIVAEINCNILPTDLYYQIKNQWKETFAPNDRLILHYTVDTYTLKNIQSILNEVDISNFFVIVVTTDINAKLKYNTILANSIDPIPITIITVNDHYTADFSVNTITKTQILEFKNSNGSTFTENEKNLLYKSKHFCMAPWVHLQVDTLGSANLCCSSQITVGHTKDNSLDEIMQSDIMNQIRDLMLNDRPVDGCQRCYSEEELGKSSYRTMFNYKFGHHIKNTHPILAYWDFRFNNLCNLACRSCHPRSSTSWYTPALITGKEVNGKALTTESLRLFSIDSDKNNKKTYQQLLAHINEVEEIYFAGGEPLIMPEHYALLNELIARKKTNVRLMYNTNMSEMSLKGQSVFDLWNCFDEVQVCGSLDGSGARGEYLRQGLKWDEAVANRKEMIEKCPNVYFWVSATTGIINALHIPDLHRELIEQELITPEDFNIQNIYGPEFMRVDRATPELRNLIVNKYNEHINWLIKHDHNGRALAGFQGLIKYLDNLKGFDKDLFWSNIKPLDEYYGVDLLDAFPELDILPKP